MTRTQEKHVLGHRWNMRDAEGGGGARRKTGRRRVTVHSKVKLTDDLKAQGLAPADIGEVIGASRGTVYRYLSIGMSLTAVIIDR